MCRVGENSERAYLRRSALYADLLISKRGYPVFTDLLALVEVDLNSHKHTTVHLSQS